MKPTGGETAGLQASQQGEWHSPNRIDLKMNFSLFIFIFSQLIFKGKPHSTDLLDLGGGN